MPGPGSYVNPDIMALKNYEDLILGRKNAAFESKVPRIIENINTTPDLLKYDIYQSDIELKMKELQYRTKFTAFDS